MRKWAFARVSLRLSDAEFFSYTPSQIDALAEAFHQERSWYLAVSTASALNSKFSHKEKILPFSPSDFLPEELDESEARRRSYEKEKYQDAILDLQFKTLTTDLCPKQKQRST